LRSWRAVFASGALHLGASAAPVSAGRALAAIVALSLLNPHVYLDTVVLLGAIGAAFPAPERPAFALGAMSASALWFAALGFGATRLSHLFARPVAWKWIDGVAGTTMLALSATVALKG
jgi:L-lysine exporter family protein LysE/ArgO